MATKDVYYVTKEPGYVVQPYDENDLLVYDENYVEKYSEYDADKTEDLSLTRVDLLEYFFVCYSDTIIDKTRILDVGYGDGSFINIMSDSGYKCYAYDVVDNKKYLHESIEVIGDNFEDYEFDAVTFFDSLEHVPVKDIRQYLQRFNTKYFMISVPWYHSMIENQQDWFMNWKHRRPNEHLHHFDSFGLMNILMSMNFKIVSISNEEDKIRYTNSNLPNILTIVARKND